MQDVEERSPRAREWSDTLQRYGSVEFRRSRRKLLPMMLISLAFVAIGCSMVASGRGSDRVIASLCLLLFGGCLVVFIRLFFRQGPALRVDSAGLHVDYTKRLDIPWGQVVDLGTFKHNRISPAQLVVVVPPEVLTDYYRNRSGWLRVLLRISQRMAPGQVRIPFLDSPDQLAAWLDEEADRLAPVPPELVILPGELLSPVWGVPNLRPVPLDRLRLSAELYDRLTDFGQRAAQPAQVLRTGDAVPEWTALAAEGRELTARLEHELGAGTSVSWFEDGPRTPDPAEV